MSALLCTALTSTCFGDKRTVLGDECSDAIAAIVGENSFDTTTSTPSSPEPSDATCYLTDLDWNNSQDIWFIFVPSDSGPANFSTCDSSSYDTSMVLYEGSCENQVACNGDGSGSSGCQLFYSSIDYTVVNGETYYIRIGGFQGATGTGTLTIDAPVEDITWVVDVNGTGDYEKIQDAIDVAYDGDDILVLPGTYTGSGSVIARLFGKEIWLHSQGGAEVTFIDGEGTRQGIKCNDGETALTHIDGFTIQKCTAFKGGGLICESSEPTISDCHFINNTAITNGGGFSAGGGIYCITGNPTIKRCTFTSNTSDLGGGLFLFESDATVADCNFYSNVCEYDGGGMEMYLGSDPTITNCVFENNIAAYGSGLVSNTDQWNPSNPVLIDCRFENNASSEFGGGLYFANGCTPTIDYCTITNNTSDLDGGGIYSASTIGPTISNSTICGNLPDQIFGAYIDNGGNTISFVCPTDFPDANGDGQIDIEDVVVVVDQWGATNSPADVDSSGVVDVHDLITVIMSWGA